MKLTTNEIAFLLGMLDKRLEKDPNCKQAEVIWNKILKSFPDLQKKLGLKLRK